MLNELEQKIRKAIPELNNLKVVNGIFKPEPIQLNHVLEYLFRHRKYAVNDTQIMDLLERYNYLESFKNQQSELIKFINEL